MRLSGPVSAKCGTLLLDVIESPLRCVVCLGEAILQAVRVRWWSNKYTNGECCSADAKRQLTWVARKQRTCMPQPVSALIDRCVRSLCRKLRRTEYYLVLQVESVNMRQALLFLAAANIRSKWVGFWLLWLKNVGLNSASRSHVASSAYSESTRWKNVQTKAEGCKGSERNGCVCRTCSQALCIS